MLGCRKATLRVLPLFALVSFTSPFAVARPAANPALAQQVAQHPTANPAPPARQRPQAVPAEPTDAQQEPSNANLQQQLLDLQQQLEQEALNRMRYGRPSYGFSGFVNDLIPVLVFVGITLALLWILRTVLENRRWNRMVKVQTETHAKLLDRFSSSQEMLAYMQSDAGKKFLEAPVFEGQRRLVSTLPFGRILWSVQIGIIAAVLGIGILSLRGRVPPDAEIGLQVFGTLTLTLGIGFLVSGGVSYILAKRFGLLERPDAFARSGHNA